MTQAECTTGQSAPQDVSPTTEETVKEQPAADASSADVCDVSVIVPTYCEAENLPALVPRLHAALQDAGLRGEIIVVDDDSPDGTPDVCAELAKHHPLRLEVRREERGLSTAVVHGMRLASGAVLVCMDADLSHPPEKVPELVEAVREAGGDFAIGSRYVPGASTDEHWGLFRWLNSRVATLLARPLTSSRDPMAGFFALRKETFAEADRLDPVGYKIGLELLVKCGCRDVREIPIHFSDRLHGKSKLNAREQLNYLRHLKRLMEYRYGNLIYALQFGAVGLSGMAVDLACFALLLGLLPHVVARALAIWVAMTWNFLLNRYVTFSRARENTLIQQYLGFCASCSAGALTNLAVSVGLGYASGFFDDHPLLAATCGILAGFLLNFALCRKWVFRMGDGER